MIESWLEKLELSPKVVASAVLAIVASVVLALVTGNDSYFVGILVALAGGGAGYWAPAGVSADTKAVSQKDVQRLARRQK